MRCKECGYRIRGKGHEEGPHHRSKTEENKDGKFDAYVLRKKDK